MNPSRNTDEHAVARRHPSENRLSNCIPHRSPSLETVSPNGRASARRVASLPAGEKLLIWNGPFERGFLDEVTPAARIDVPLGVADHARFEPLLPLHCFEDG